MSDHVLSRKIHDDHKKIGRTDRIEHVSTSSDEKLPEQKDEAAVQDWTPEEERKIV